MLGVDVSFNVNRSENEKTEVNILTPQEVQEHESQEPEQLQEEQEL